MRSELDQILDALYSAQPITLKQPKKVEAIIIKRCSSCNQFSCDCVEEVRVEREVYGTD